MSGPTPAEVGFAGYTSCPITGNCMGSLAGHCMASGECLVGLALLHLNEKCDLQRRAESDPAPSRQEPTA